MKVWKLAIGAVIFGALFIAGAAWLAITVGKAILN